MENLATTESPPLSRRVNRWTFVIAGLIASLVSGSALTLLVSLITPSLTAEFGWDRGQITLGTSITAITGGIGIVTSGLFIDRFGPTRAPRVYAVIYGCGIASLSLLPNALWVFYGICMIIGLGTLTGSSIVHSLVINAWFNKRRGMALGILNVGVGMCGVIMPYVLSFFIASLGWRGATAVTGLLMGGLPLCVYLFIYRMPEKYERERVAARSAGSTAGVPLWQIVRGSRQFWLLLGAIFLVTGTTFGMLSQMTLLARDRGFELPVALAAVATLSLSGVATRLIVGLLLDRVWAPLIATVSFSLAAGGLVLVVFVPSSAAFFIGAALLGVALGSEGDLIAYIVSRYFPAHSTGRVLTVVFLGYVWGVAVGTLLLGLSYSATGSYAVGAVVLVVLVVIAAIAMLFMGPYTQDLRAADHDLVEAASAEADQIKEKA
jgi:MFS family permease